MPQQAAADSTIRNAHDHSYLRRLCGDVLGVGSAPNGRFGLAAGCLLWLIASSPVSGRDVPQFRAEVLSTGASMGYQLVAADLNGDGKKDLLAVDEQAAAAGD